MNSPSRRIRSSGTPIGSFGIDGRIEIADSNAADEIDDSETEYLDGIVSGSDAAPFDVRDSDMTLTYDGSPALAVGAYEFDLTVSGDAGLANRTIIGKGEGNGHRIQRGSGCAYYFPQDAGGR